MKRYLKREYNLLKEEGFRLKSDLIRAYNKYIRKTKTLEDWVEIK